MTLDTFFHNFELLADALGGVPKLRELILQLAVQGKLVPQDPADEPASVLLERIRAARNGQGKLWQTEAQLVEDAPYAVPEGWTWVTIGDIVTHNGVFIDGDWVESKDQDPNGQVRLIQLADVGDGVYRDKSSRYLTEYKAIELGCTYLKAGDVLIARMPDPLGRACIFPGDSKPSVTVVDVCIVRTGTEDIDHRWLVHAVNSLYFRAAINQVKSGTTRERISRGNLAKLKLLLPPTAEQRRIVAKVDQLMALCDELEQKLRAAQDGSAALLAAVARQVVTATQQP